MDLTWTVSQKAGPSFGNRLVLSRPAPNKAATMLPQDFAGNNKDPMEYQKESKKIR